MTRSEQLWVGQQIRRLATLGAPQAVVDRWNAWLDASTNLPTTAVEREWLAERLDDPEARLPVPVVFN